MLKRNDLLTESLTLRQIWPFSSLTRVVPKRVTISLALASMLALTACQKNTPDATETDRVVENPKAAKINVQLGMGYLQQNQMERAKRKLLLALQQDPKSSIAYGAMGYYLERTDELQQANQYYQKAIQLAPADGGPYNNYGAFLCRQGNYPQAIQNFMTAVNKPNYVKVAQAYENAGLCAIKMKKMAEAKNYFQRAVANDPDSPQALAELAQLSYKDKAYQKADHYLKALSNNNEPDASIAWLGFQVATKLNDKPGALRYAHILAAKYSDSEEFKQLQQQQNSKGMVS